MWCQHVWVKIGRCPCPHVLAPYTWWVRGGATARLHARLKLYDSRVGSLTLCVGARLNVCSVNQIKPNQIKSNQIKSNQISQSGLYALRGAGAKLYTNPACSTIHFQFALPTVFGPPKPPLPHGLPMQHSLYPVMNGTFGNVSRQFPIRSTTNSGPTLDLRGADDTCCSFQAGRISGYSSIQSMYGGGPTMDRQSFRKWRSKACMSSW